MELKPCPFCGETQVCVREEHWTVPLEGAYLPTTYSCGCESDVCPAQPTVSDTYTSEEEAIEAWNTRAERTCHPTTGKFESFDYCSACGAMLTRYVEPGRAAYCPGCGAKVVES